jgi:esterase/lipase superfamily enzyme
VLLTATVRPRAEFFAELATKVQQADVPAAFLFVHGFAVTFEDAARRTAQIAYDLGFSGAAIFYSWPSKGSKFAYRDDEKTIEQVKDNLSNFLTDVLEQSQAQKVFLIAHSMGNRAMTHAIATVLAERPDLRQRLSEVILTAPDIDAEVFTREIAPALIDGGRPITLYASTKDLALEASKMVNGAPRAGDAGAGLVVIGGIETIDATAVDTSLVGHSYFAEERSVLADVFYLVREGFRADKRFGLRVRNIDRGRYWVFRP